MIGSAPFDLDFEWPAEILIATYDDQGFWKVEDDVHLAIAATSQVDLMQALAACGHSGSAHVRPVQTERFLGDLKGCRGTVPTGIVLFGPCGIEIARRYAR